MDLSNIFGIIVTIFVGLYVIQFIEDKKDKNKYLKDMLVNRTNIILDRIQYLETLVNRRDYKFHDALSTLKAIMVFFNNIVTVTILNGSNLRKDIDFVQTKAVEHKAELVTLLTDIDKSDYIATSLNNNITLVDNTTDLIIKLYEFESDIFNLQHIISQIDGNSNDKSA